MTDLHTRESMLLFTEARPVRALALDNVDLCVQRKRGGAAAAAAGGGGPLTAMAGDMRVWAATDSSTVHQWPGGASTVPEAAAAPFVAGSSPFATRSMRRRNDDPHDASAACQHTSPNVTIAGAPAVVQVRANCHTRPMPSMSRWLYACGLFSRIIRRESHPGSQLYQRLRHLHLAVERRYVQRVPPPSRPHR